MSLCDDSIKRAMCRFLTPLTGEPTEWTAPRCSSREMYAMAYLAYLAYFPNLVIGCCRAFCLPLINQQQLPLGAQKLRQHIRAARSIALCGCALWGVCWMCQHHGLWLYSIRHSCHFLLWSSCQHTHTAATYMRSLQCVRLPRRLKDGFASINKVTVSEAVGTA